ncbi:excalibur calcium-binding domain-containing protein [Lysinibacillus sp. NPDC097279]|uniref:excalibur calcium-binding domain-containing protein n=1 Tax=Lysinibacillus sp. NPDC097279 TaxID=3364143 RepID=UPI00381EFCD9
MKGCLSLIVVIIVLSILITYPLFILGVVLIWWGIHEYKINKQLKAKSKLIPTIITLGFIFSISGCALTLSKDTEKDNAETSKSDSEAIVNEEQTEADATPINDTADSPTSTPEKEPEPEPEPAPQVEQEEVKEEPVVNNTPDQESNNSTESNSNTGISETDSSSNTQQETVNTVTTPSAPQREYYQNCTELRKVYPSGVPSDHPAYASKHDRDKDGWACER